MKFPKKGIAREHLLKQMEDARSEDLKWQTGKSFCLVYYPEPQYYDLVKEAYNLFFTENALNPMSFPSVRGFENEVVAMMSDLLHGDDSVVGSMTTGGTESILMAMKTARSWGKHEKSISSPEVIVPVTVHPAFAKAAYYFGIELKFAEVDSDYKVKVSHVAELISSNTVMIVGSAPAYPHGAIDPLESLSDLAQENEVLMHVDACIGGMVLPFLNELNYDLPAFDFTLPGVTSISVDLHKFGYAAKGASVVLYRNKELRKHQFFVFTEWSGGVYASPAMSGSRPGGSIAAAYAALKGIGMEGYLHMAKKMMRSTQLLKDGIQAIPELNLMSENDMSILAFDSQKVNIYEVADELNLKGWNFERLQLPPGIHLTINQIHDDKVVNEFLKDLKEAVSKASAFSIDKLTHQVQVELVKRLVSILPEGLIAKLQSSFGGANPAEQHRTAALYGMMGALSGTEDLDEMVLNMLDGLFKVK